jgi:hypothetical protein
MLRIARAPTDRRKSPDVILAALTLRLLEVLEQAGVERG